MISGIIGLYMHSHISHLRPILLYRNTNLLANQMGFFNTHRRLNFNIHIHMSVGTIKLNVFFQWTMARHLLQVDALQKMAGHRPLKEYIQKFVGSHDPDFAMQGQFLQTLLQRYEDLTQAYQALDTAAPWAQPLLFVRYFHSDVAASTWHHFELGLPLTVEGAIYAVIGVIVGMVFYRLFRRTFSFQKAS